MANTIHPTAVIDPGAELGDGIEVGPYCVIGAGVKIGDGCRLHALVTVDGPTTIGESNEFYSHSAIGGRTQDLKYRGEPTYLEIGNGNTFREFVTIHRSGNAEEITRIGDRGNFLAYSHIAHDCRVGDDVIFSNNGTLAGHVTVEDHAIIGGLTAVHQFCRIGTHAILGGCTKIVQDVPPYMIADGNPAEIRAVNKVGLERRGFSDESVKALRSAHKKLYRSDLNVSQACDEIATELGGNTEIDHLVKFVTESERGIIR